MLHLPQQILHSTIKLCVIVKYSSRLEHIKSILILGLNDNYFFRILQSHLLVDPVNNWMQRTFLLDKVNWCYHMDKMFIHVLKMLHLKLRVTFLTKISDYQVVVCFISFSKFLGVFFLVHKWMRTNMCNFHLFIFVTMKMLDLVIFTRNSCLKMV